MAITYRSKGVHTNRHGGKSGRKARTRTGAPFKPKPRTVLDTIETAKKAGGGEEALKKTMAMVKQEPKKGSRMQELGKALKSAAADMKEGEAAATAEFRAGAQADEAAMAQTGAQMRAGRPGRAQEIIKNRRV